MTYRKKLIEVALPLDAINEASAREKSIRHGHPSTLHPWWSRKPLATCRAVIFSSLVDDPSAHPEQFPTEEVQTAERERLFGIIRKLVKWENSTNKTVLDAARAEILRSTDGNPPPLLDPFCGGGSIPLEAQRLGLEAYGSDLNPVAVLITKALIEIPPEFAGEPPVNPESRAKMSSSEGWTGARGLAEDVHYYGSWMRDEAQKRIGHLYPKVTLSKEQGGGEATVIAWLWVRTVQCPNPACGARMPLTSKWTLSTKAGKKVWVEPIVDRITKTVRFEVRSGQGGSADGTINRQGATCIVCSTPVPFDRIRAEGRAGRMSAQMIAVVAEGQRNRIYLSPTKEQVAVASQAQPEWAPETDLPEQALGFRVQLYGMTTHRDLFSPRQLVALTTFSDLVGEARERAERDAIAAGLPDDGVPLAAGGMGALAHGEAVAIFLGLVVSKAAVFLNSLARWRAGEGKSAPAFGRQVISMVWDFAEVNPFAGAGGDLLGIVNGATKTILGVYSGKVGHVTLEDAASTKHTSLRYLVSTDPPYYDNIGYADLSDFFYVWLRRSLGVIYPNLFGTMLVPKTEELVANPHRFAGGKREAQEFFETGLGAAFIGIRAAAQPDYPLTVYYAFKQTESDNDDSDDSAATTGSAAMASTGREYRASRPMPWRMSWARATRPSRLRCTSRTSSARSSVVAISVAVQPRGSPAANTAATASAWSPSSVVCRACVTISRPSLSYTPGVPTGSSGPLAPVRLV